MPEPSPSLSSVREKEVVVAPSESFPSGSGRLWTLTLAVENHRKKLAYHLLSTNSVLHATFAVVAFFKCHQCAKCLLQCVPQKQFLKNGGPLEKVTFHNFQTNVFELVISGSVLNLGGAGRSLMRPRLPSRVEPKSLHGGGRLYNFSPFWTKRTLSKSKVQTTKCTILWRLCVQSELKDEVLEPSSSVSSVREEEVVVVPSQGFPSGSENEAGSKR